jgi:hypothetical protein
MTDQRSETGQTVVVTTMASDSHTWNPVFLLLPTSAAASLNLAPEMGRALLLAFGRGYWDIPYLDL